MSDRITLAIWGDAEVEDAARERRQWIADEVLARELRVGRDGAAPPPETFDAMQAVELDGLAATIAITREH